MRKKGRAVLLAALTALFAGLYFLDALPAADALAHDYWLSGERTPAANIVIIGIDERSVNEIGMWPWPRLYVADAAAAAARHGAAAIGVNVLYDAPSDDPAADQPLIAAAQATDRLVLAGMALFDDVYQGRLEAVDYVLPFDAVRKETRAGFINVMPDEGDGVLRSGLMSLQYGDIRIYSLSMEVYRVYCRSMGVTPRDDLPLDAFGQMDIAYAARPGGFTTLSLWGVLNDEYPPSVFENAIVLIGPYTPGIGESFLTPLDRRNRTYGVEVYANIIQSLLEGHFKSDAPHWVNLLALALCAVGVGAVVQLLKKPVWVTLGVFGLLVLLFAAAKLAYGWQDMIIKTGGCALFLLVCYIASLVLSVLTAQQDRHHIQSLFGRFVAPEVVAEIVSGRVRVQLGGSEREISLLFVDIRGFTAFSEVNPADKVVEMVNRYLSLSSTAIQRHGGTIDKYIGDATMGVFNAPNEMADHPLQAVRAAWEMKQGAGTLREEILREYGVDLQFGVGINTGVAVVGNMGSEFRMDYTAIGDTVNTAARLESSAAKGQILISEATYQRVKNHVAVQDLGVIHVKNKAIGIQVYSVEDVRV